MKGAFSSPESVLERFTSSVLFPDTPYSNESGGDPAVIPNLSYEQFIQFHKDYYHPANSYIYLYGDMDMEEKLKWLDENYLSAFDAIEVDSEIKYQKPFEEIRELEMEYSISSEESEEDNTYLSYNKSSGQVWMKSCIWRFRFWTMHCSLHRVTAEKSAFGCRNRKRYHGFL